MDHRGSPKLNILARGCVDDVEGSCLRGGAMDLTAAPLLWSSSYFLKFLFVYWLRWVSVTVLSLPLVAVSRGYYPVAVCGLLTAAASLVLEPRL